MICFTGDTHGDFSRLATKRFKKQTKMNKSDFVIICGDFGIWDKKDEHLWDWLESKPFTTLFVDGNHENYDLLKEYAVESWNGGLVQKIRPSVIHLMRGQIYNIDNKTVFTMGGAKSHDIQDGILEPDDKYIRQKIRRLKRRNAMYRINHVSWWKEEMPNDEEYALAIENLEKVNWKVDIIISHCAPSSIVQKIFENTDRNDELTDFLEEIKQKCDFKFWFFGHYHDNAIIDDKFILLYESIV